ncbi:MAG: hypothetical protein ABI689_03420 [Thermoanaerobaculia bacterium]
MRTARWLSVFTVLWTVPACDAQISAHQGAPIVEPTKRFVSPMVLDIPVPQIQGVRQAGRLPIGGIGSYRCDDVALSSLMVVLAPFGKGKRIFDFTGAIVVPDSFDRYVTLIFTLTDGTKRQFASVTKADISAEERKMKLFTVRLAVDRATGKAIDEAESLNLRITMVVRGDW